MAGKDPGDLVWTTWGTDGFLYPAIVVRLEGPTAHVAYLDGDEGDVPVSGLFVTEIPVGQRVNMNWKGQRTYYNGQVVAKIGMAIDVAYDDGDRGWGTIAQCRVQTSQPPRLS